MKLYIWVALSFIVLLPIVAYLDSLFMTGEAVLDFYYFLEVSFGEFLAFWLGIGLMKRLQRKSNLEEAHLVKDLVVC